MKFLSLIAAILFAAPLAAQPVVEVGVEIPVEIFVEQAGTTARVHFAPASVFVGGDVALSVDGEVAATISHSLLGGSFHPFPFGGPGADAAFIDFEFAVDDPVAELPHLYQVHRPFGNLTPDDVQQLVYANPNPPVLFAVDHVQWEIHMPDTVLPANGASVQIPITITPDGPVEFQGCQFSWTWDPDRIHVALVALPAPPATWLGEVISPSFAASVLHNEPTQYPLGWRPEVIYPAGHGHFGMIVDYMFTRNPHFLAGESMLLVSLLVSARPGVTPGPVDFTMTNYFQEPLVIPNHTGTAVNSLDYRRPGNPTTCSFRQRTEGEFLLWAPPVITIAPPALTITPGDCNADGVRNLSDAIGMLSFMFMGGSVECASAVDVNRDGTPNITDPMALLAHLFGGGPILGECASDAAILDCSLSSCP